MVKRCVDAKSIIIAWQDNNNAIVFMISGFNSCDNVGFISGVRDIQTNPIVVLKRLMPCGDVVYEGY